MTKYWYYSILDDVLSWSLSYAINVFFSYARLNPNEIVNAKRINMKAVSFIKKKLLTEVNIVVELLLGVTRTR